MLIFVLTFFSMEALLKEPLEISKFSYKYNSSTYIFTTYVTIKNNLPTKLTDITISIIFGGFGVPNSIEVLELGSREIYDWKSERTSSSEAYGPSKVIVKCKEGYSITFPDSKFSFFSFVFHFSSFFFSILAGIVFVIPSWLIVNRKHNKKLKQLENMLLEKGIVDITETSHIIGVNVVEMKELFSELVEKERIHGISIQSMFIMDSYLIEYINKSGRVNLQSMAEDLGISIDIAGNILHKLFDEKKIQGTFTSDDKNFVTEERLMEEIGKNLE